MTISVLLFYMTRATTRLVMAVLLLLRSSHWPDTVDAWVPVRAPGWRRQHLASANIVSLWGRAEARQLVSDGMQAFRQGQIEDSIRLFDAADAQVGDGSLHPFLWQRGLSLYYAGRFDEASQQFRADVAVNPSDTEEIVWDIASQLRLRPKKFPVPNQMSFPMGVGDRRRIMVCDYACVWK